MTLDPCAGNLPENGGDDCRSTHHIMDALARIETNLDSFSNKQLTMLQHLEALLPSMSKSGHKNTGFFHACEEIDGESYANVSLRPSPNACESVTLDAQDDLDDKRDAKLQPAQAYVSAFSRGSSPEVALTTKGETSASRQLGPSCVSASVRGSPREDVHFGSHAEIHDKRDTNALPQPSQARPSAHARNSLASAFTRVKAGSMSSFDDFGSYDGTTSLPTGWPRGVEMRDMRNMFKVGSGEELSRVKSILKKNRLVARSTSLEKEEESQRVAIVGPDAELRMMQRTVAYLHRTCRRTIFLPGSSAKVIVDSMGVFLLLYDAVVTPFVIAWGLKIEGWIFVSSVLITIYWTVDMLFSSRLAYYADGELETRPSVILKNYLKTWFLFDAIIVGSDYQGMITTIYNSTTSSTDEAPQSVQGPDTAIARLAKSGRLMRLIGLARLGRMRHFLDDLFGGFEIGFAFYDMAKLMAFLVWCIHLVGCLWFMIRSSKENLEGSMVQQYSSAVLWSTTTLISGGTYIIPDRIPERFLACVCVLFGLLFLSYLVSSLSSTAMELKMMQEEKAKYMFTLDRFLSHHHLRRDLASLAHIQVKAHLKHRSKAMLQVHQVPALEFLSGRLLTSINIELCRPHLYRHQFFTIWTISDTQFVESICVQAIAFTNLMPKWNLSYSGTKGTRAFLMIKGAAIYTQSEGTSRVEETVDVESGIWTSEAALWTHWTHVGDLTSLRLSEIVSLDGDIVVPLIEKSPVLSQIAFEYAQQFHACVCSSCPPANPWPSDIMIHGVEFTHLLRTSLSLHVRNIVGFATIEELRTNSQLFFVSMATRNLAAEVQMGKSILYVVSNGRRLQVERGVSLVRVRVVRGDGRILWNIAEKSRGELLYTLKLTYPGSKQRHNEMISDAVERVLTELRHVIGDVNFVSSEATSEAGHSKKLEIPTRYSITTFNYKLQGDTFEGGTSGCGQESSRTVHTLDTLQKYLLSSTTGCSKRGDTLMFHAWLSEEELKLIKDMGHRADGLIQTAASSAESPPVRFSLRSSVPGDSERGSEIIVSTEPDSATKATETFDL